MSSQHTPTQTLPDHNTALMHASHEGSHFHFLNHLATVKVPADGVRSMSVVEFLAPRGFGPPLHVHRDEDELFVIVEGELAFLAGDDRFEFGAGSIAYLPRARPHTFQVLSDTARLINVTSSNTVIPQFDKMVSSLGDPTTTATMPDPSPIDPGLVAEMCAQHGIDIVGPPPAPLADSPGNHGGQL